MQIELQKYFVYYSFESTTDLYFSSDFIRVVLMAVECPGSV